MKFPALVVVLLIGCVSVCTGQGFIPPTLETASFVPPVLKENTEFIFLAMVDEQYKAPVAGFTLKEPGIKMEIAAGYRLECDGETCQLVLDVDEHEEISYMMGEDSHAMHSERHGLFRRLFQFRSKRVSARRERGGFLRRLFGRRGGSESHDMGSHGMSVAFMGGG